MYGGVHGVFFKLLIWYLYPDFFLNLQSLKKGKFQSVQRSNLAPVNHRRPGPIKQSWFKHRSDATENTQGR